MGSAAQEIIIRDVHRDDFDQWLPLWIENNNGQHNDEVTKETWSRLNNAIFPVHGLMATQEKQIVGFVHYVLHPITGHLNQACYMQDLYVSPSHRRFGIGRRLVGSLSDIGKEEEWARLYWLADKNDNTAQKFYRDIGVNLDFSFHMHPLS